MSAAVETRLRQPGDRWLLDHIAPDVFVRAIDAVQLTEPGVVSA
jgi:hypothetical protein